MRSRSGPQWGPSRPLEEQSEWPTHASLIDGLVDAGFVVLGGPLADEHRVQTDTIEPWTIRLDARRT